MKRSISLWQFLGFSITAFCGTVLHFLYDLTNKSIFIAPFSGVNESTWEHMKLLFFPMFLFAIVECFFFKEHKNFWCIKLFGIILGLISIPVIFYTYNGAIGKSPDWINISIFYIAAALTYIVEAMLFRKKQLKCSNPSVAFLTICLIAILFFIFTFHTPRLAVFEDPVSGIYGLN